MSSASPSLTSATNGASSVVGFDDEEPQGTESAGDFEPDVLKEF